MRGSSCEHAIVTDDALVLRDGVVDHARSFLVVVGVAVLDDAPRCSHRA